MEAAIAKTLLKVVPSAEEVIRLHKDCVPPSQWGATFWKADMLDEESDEVSYFVKILKGQNGYESLAGEFDSAKVIDTASSGLIPTPFAFGTLEDHNDLHFLVYTFYELDKSPPDIDYLCEQLSVLHSHSSPNGKFGFDRATYIGNLSQKNDWCDSWEIFFVEGLKHVLKLREERAGRSEELEALLPDLFEKVVPRLLSPMETGGRSVTPVLVHGDLRVGNSAAVEGSRGRGVVFNPASFYAHREYEFGNWRPERNGFINPPEDLQQKSLQHIEQYMSLPGVGKSDPQEDFWDRNALYCLKFDAQAAALYPQNETFLKLLVDGASTLVEKFGELDRGVKTAAADNTTASQPMSGKPRDIEK